MAMTKAARMAMEMMRKSMPTKSMSQANAQRVEAAIRKNPKLYKGLAPSKVLEMLPPKGMTGKVVGTPITKGKRKKKATHELVYEDDKNYPTMKKINRKPTHELVYEDDKNYPTMKKIVTKKFVGGALRKGIKIGKDVLGKFTTSGKGVKDKTGQTKTIVRRDSIQDEVTGKIKTNQGKGKNVGITQAQDKKTGKIKTIKKSRQNTIDNKVRNTKALAGAKNIGKTSILVGGLGISSKVDNEGVAKTVKPFTPKSVAMPTPKPKNKMYMKEMSGMSGKSAKNAPDSNVEFVVGKAKKKLFGGGKVGGMKAGPATPNRLY